MCIRDRPCGDDANALAFAQALEAQGFWVSAIRPPTVPEGKSLLRITLSALHAPTEIDALLDALAFARDAIDQGFGADFKPAAEHAGRTPRTTRAARSRRSASRCCRRCSSP